MRRKAFPIRVADRALYVIIRLWDTILAEIERRASVGWLAITHRLLNVSYDDQAKVEKHMAVARRKLSRKSDPPAYAAMLANGPSRRREALTLIMFGKMTREDRFQFAKQAAATTMDNAGTDDCLIVGLSTQEPSVPYDFLAILRRGARNISLAEAHDLNRGQPSA